MARPMTHFIEDRKTHSKDKKNVKRNLLFAPLFPHLTKEEYHLLNSFLDIIDDVLRLSAKQKASLPKDIRRLFHALTDERDKKSVDYINTPTQLSAYIYYYLWWNLYRFVRLFDSLSFFLKDGNVVGDFGAGPLTFIIALWISKPYLRERELSFYCIDISSKVMSVGERLFYALCEFFYKDRDVKNKQVYKKWKIIRVCGKFGSKIKDKLDLFVSSNMFNEICWDKIRNIDKDCLRYTNIIDSYLKKSGEALIIEPGLPIGGTLISSFRASFIKKGYKILSPCSHAEDCAIHNRISLSTKSKKWCHFSCNTNDAPKNLLALSELAHLGKKTVSLSYIYTKKSNIEESDKNQSFLTMKRREDQAIFITAIITSNIIKLKDKKIGFYACSKIGFLLLRMEEKDFLIKEKQMKLKSGSYIKIKEEGIKKDKKDRKTGAIIVEI